MAKRHVNGVDMAYSEAGCGAPLLLLHAGIADRAMWEDVTPMLAERFRVIACDLRGFGETPLPDGPFVYAADVVALLDDARLAEHGIADRLVEQLGKPRHVHALLLPREVDGALDVGGDLLLDAPVADPDRFARAHHACAREPEPYLGLRGLEVVVE